MMTWSVSSCFCNLHHLVTSSCIDLICRSLLSLIVKVLYCGICASDLHCMSSGWRDMEAANAFPQVAGHEIVGEVLKVGKDVRNIKKGDIVGVGAQSDSCMNCQWCHESTYICRREFERGLTSKTGSSTVSTAKLELTMASTNVARPRVRRPGGDMEITGGDPPISVLSSHRVSTWRLPHQCSVQALPFIRL
jgi:hypothetical protein